ncbi:MFS transporter [Streptomyces sp. NPDC001941]|uniref:MFS transporter n=1 Tax=Streptomyces sp. NPDC001941 TaxID=3154659 RepID=UPI00332C461A
MLTILLVGAFMATLDFFIVNVAVPSIASDLSASSGETQLVVVVYGLVYASFLVIGGRLGDHWGHKKAYVIGLALFTATSALCGFAPNAWWLIVGRALQGAASVVLYPQVLALIQIHYPPEERSKVMRVYGFALGAAMAVGQLLGGVLISVDLFGLSWRWVFLVNLPVGLVALLLAPRLIPQSPPGAGLRLDRAGVLLCASGLVLLVLPLTVGRSTGWPAWALAMLAVSVVVLAVFWWWERREESLGRDPLLPPSLLRVPGLRTGLLAVLPFYASLSSHVYVIALLLQSGRGLDPLEAGLVTCPMFIGFCVASMSSHALSKRFGTRPLLVAMCGQVVLFSAQYLLVPHPGQVGTVALSVLLGANGLCTGSVVGPLLGLVLDGVAPGRAGAASGLLATTQQVAGSVGTAVIGIAFYGLALRAQPDPAQVTEGYRHGMVFLIVMALLTLTGLYRLTRARAARQEEAEPAPA